MLGNGMTALPESPPREHPWSGICWAESAQTRPGSRMETGDKGHTEAERRRGGGVGGRLMGGRERLCFRLVLVRGCEIQPGVRAATYERFPFFALQSCSVSPVQIYHPDVTSVVFPAAFLRKPKAFGAGFCQSSTVRGRAARRQKTKRIGSGLSKCRNLWNSRGNVLRGPQLHLEKKTNCGAGSRVS